MINITKQTPNVDKDVEKEKNVYTAGQKKLVNLLCSSKSIILYSYTIFWYISTGI